MSFARHCHTLVEPDSQPQSTAMPDLIPPLLCLGLGFIMRHLDPVSAIWLAKSMER